MTMRPPAWNDERELIGYVVQAITDLTSWGTVVPAHGPTNVAAHAVLATRHDEQRKATLAKYGLSRSPFRSVPQYSEADLEAEAVALGKRGNYLRLAILDRIRWPFRLSTAQLIADIKAGRHKRTHRPPLTDAQRFNQTPIHQAAYLYPIVVRMLAEWYPAQPIGTINERAMAIVVDIKQVSSETLRIYLRRSKRDRRRLVS